MISATPYESFDRIGTNTVHLRVGDQGVDEEPTYRDARIDGEVLSDGSAYFTMGDGQRERLWPQQYTAWTRHGS